MPTLPSRSKPKSAYTPWFHRLRKGSRPVAPWFMLPMFNNSHPLEVLKARVRHWESLDDQYSKCRNGDQELVRKGLETLPDDLRWLASRLEVLLESGYKSVSD